jgi:hypothetical protein
MIRNFFFYLALVCLPLVSFADTSEFFISVFGGEDLEPPTTPTLLTVEPVASTQIDVTWSASTDNVQLSGYVLFRDSVAIATTTLTSFADTGLTPSTLYYYDVYAFDHLGNISTTSNALATTTLATPVVPPAATSTSGSPSSATLVFQLVDLQIVTSPNSALFSWETTLPSRFALRWGRNDSYDDGYILNDIYRREHQTVINNLEPGTIYVYELMGYSPTGRAVVLDKGEFKTASGMVPSAPSNVRDLTARVVDDGVLLSYQIPTEVEGARVRIVRNHLGFPSDLYDGAVVYEGEGDVFLDKTAFSTYQSQYYTVFVIAADGSVSSGAVIFVQKNETPPRPPDEPGSPVPPRGVPTSTPPLPPSEPEIPLLDFGFDRGFISIVQGPKTFTFTDEVITISSTEQFVIRIPYDSVPDHLKSIVVTLLSPTDPDRSYSFLLRINKDRTAYEATIAPLQAVGLSRIQIEIFDFERMVVGRYQKLVEFSEPEEAPEVIFPDKIVETFKLFFLPMTLIIIAILLLLFFLYRRSKETEDKH